MEAIYKFYIKKCVYIIIDEVKASPWKTACGLQGPKPSSNYYIYAF